MTISQIIELLDAKVVCGHNHLDKEIEFAFASDMMSDVLTLDANNILLITGLANVQTVRTAEMSCARCILIVRNKKVTPEMADLAQQNDLILMEYKGSMFRASGILYEAGIKPVY